MKGVLVGDDHLCLMDRSRLRFAENVDTCTFGVEGATAESLLAKALLEFLRTVTPVLFVFKVLPRGGATAEAEAARQNLNRMLMRAIRGMVDVVIINADTRFIDKEKRPKEAHFGEDGYISRYVGVRVLANLLKLVVIKRLGAHWAGPRPRIEMCQLVFCRHCEAEGHRTGQCRAFRRCPEDSPKPAPYVDDV
ncbi:uncharacterized protein LOC115319358 [Ixodes scapularis]|uniref:uncharacterized protein LOC115319358 n=1 Tax=Ixodes scapularis TaxID=6945 RepID=UPI001A9DECBC|nr:uncharacterized protein LOC115319358 [Ixodes scapularis]